MVLTGRLFGLAVLLSRPACQAYAQAPDYWTQLKTADTFVTWPQFAAVPTASFQSFLDETTATETPTATPTVPLTTEQQGVSLLGDQYLDLKPGLSYTIQLNGKGAFYATCWYPVSGFYGNLQRYLFYGTLLFALFARKHEWLIMGALATSLTYSGAAAVHAMIMTWSRQNIANNDMYACLGILALSAAFVVPLLNWSSTIRNMGKDREENSVGRTIIIYWGFMIFVGFFSQFISIFRAIARTTIKAKSRSFVLYGFSSAQNITCTPASGVLDLTADQQHAWDAFFTTPAFLEANSCTNPCTNIRDPWNEGANYYTALRDPGDLVSLTAIQINHFVQVSQLNARQTRYMQWYMNGFFITGTAVLIWIILQGITAIFFGRRSPREVRNTTYVRLTKLFAKNVGSARASTFASMDSAARVESDLKFNVGQHKVASRFAHTISFGLYMWAWSAAVLSPVLAVASVVATEYFMSEVPQNDQNFAVDQWGGWAGTGLVLLVAIAFKFHGMFEDAVIRGLNALFGWLYSVFHGKRHRANSAKLKVVRESNRHMLWIMATNFVVRFTIDLYRAVANGIRNEWHDLSKFLWRDSWNTAVQHQGQGHLRRRRAVAGDQIKVPDGWNDLYDEWLDADEFIEAVKLFDAEYRSVHGRGYKWQPRVTGEMQLRAEFDAQLFHDLFRKGKGPEVNLQTTYSMAQEQRGRSLGHIDWVPNVANRSRTGSNHVRIEDHPAFRNQMMSPSSSDSEDDEIELQKIQNALNNPGKHYQPVSGHSAPTNAGLEDEAAGRDWASRYQNPDSTGNGVVGVPVSRFAARQDRYNAALSPATSPQMDRNGNFIDPGIAPPPPITRPRRIPSQALVYNFSPATTSPPQYAAGGMTQARMPYYVPRAPERVPSYDTSERTYGAHANGRSEGFSQVTSPQGVSSQLWTARKPSKKRTRSDMDKTLPPPPPPPPPQISHTPTPTASAGPSAPSSRAEPSSFWMNEFAYEHGGLGTGAGGSGNEAAELPGQHYLLPRGGVSADASISELSSDARSVRRERWRGGS